MGRAKLFLNNGSALLAGDGQFIVSEYAGPAEEAVLVCESAKHNFHGVTT